MPQGRYFRPKDKSLSGTDYDSKLEERLHGGALAGTEHHPERISYVWAHKYEPDFKANDIYIECKGYFQDRNDCTKYIWVRKSLPEGTELVFCFETPTKPIHFQPKRQDGSRMTHAEWAEKNGFRWFSEQTIGELLNAN